MRKLIQRIVHNLDLKIAAILLALITWYYLTTAGLEERRFENVAVRVINLRPDVARLKLEPREVSVTLKGARGQLDALEGRQLVAVVDLGDVQLETGQTLTPQIPLRGSGIRLAAGEDGLAHLPPNVHFARAEPDAVRLTLNSVIKKLLPVEVVVEGSPAPGFVRKTTVLPQSVRVSGPFQLLQNLSSITTEPIPIEGLRERLDREVRLQRTVSTSEYGAVPISPDPPTVNVSLDVTEQPAERTIERVPVRLAAAPKTLAVIQQKVREVTVKLRGPRRLIRDIDAPSLVAQINLEGEQPPARATEVKSYFLLRENIRQVAERGGARPLAPGIDVLEVQPKTVQLTLDRLGTRTLAVKASLEGKPAEDYEISEVGVVPEKVTVQGPRSVLRSMKAIQTFPVLVTGLKESLRRSVPLAETVDAGPFKRVRIEPSQRVVDVVVTVGEQRVRKELKSLPVHLLLTPRVAFNIRVDMERRTIGPVTFIGPRSAMEHFGPDSVVAFVRLEIKTAADLRPTIREVKFYISDPRVHPAPETKPIPIKMEFPPLERGPGAPAPKRKSLPP